MSASKGLDPVVEANRKLLHDRSQLGIAKYGTTLAAGGYSQKELLTHALQESLDLANYLQAELMRQEQSVELTDAQIDAIAAEHEAKYGQLCDAEDLRMFGRACATVAAARPAVAPAKTTLPEGWVALSIQFNGREDETEEVAYGPKPMMDRLGKWLDKHFARVIADRDALSVAEAGKAVAHVVDIDRKNNESIINCALEVGTPLYRAVPSARTLSDADILRIAAEQDYGDEDPKCIIRLARVILAAVSTPAEAPSEWKFATFEDWLASPISGHGDQYAYARLAFDAARALQGKSEAPKKET